MQCTMLKAKLHQARISHAELEYEGSCAIDGELLDMAGILEYEQVDLYNLENGERFTTYAIRAEEGSKIISINGAAAHKGEPGQRVIICAYAAYSSAELANYQPRLVYLDEGNTIKNTSNTIPVQVA
jgi:aspartate 1-decarboxylase